MAPNAGITPFRSEKNTNWEGGWRVPAFVRWPKRFKAGTVLNGVVMLSVFGQLRGLGNSVVDAVKAKYSGVAVTATEPVFGYMAAAMGLEMLNEEFQTASMNETEPSPRQVAAFEDSLKGGTAKILFYNSQVTDDTSTRLLALAKASNVRVIGVTETEPAGHTIQTWFAGQIADVQAALAASP